MLCGCVRSFGLANRNSGLPNWSSGLPCRSFGSPANGTARLGFCPRAGYQFCVNR
jgi:hypothetical protein